MRGMLAPATDAYWRFVALAGRPSAAAARVLRRHSRRLAAPRPCGRCTWPPTRSSRTRRTEPPSSSGATPTPANATGDLTVISPRLRPLPAPFLVKRFIRQPHPWLARRRRPAQPGDAGSRRRFGSGIASARPHIVERHPPAHVFQLHHGRGPGDLPVAGSRCRFAGATHLTAWGPA